MKLRHCQGDALNLTHPARNDFRKQFVVASSEVVQSVSNGIAAA